MKLIYLTAVTGMVVLAPQHAVSAANVLLKPAHTESGYIARLLINETPFPGERGWVSETDTRAAMLFGLSVNQTSTTSLTNASSLSMRWISSGQLMMTSRLSAISTGSVDDGSRRSPP